MVGLERRIRLQLELDQQRSKEEVRTAARMQEHRVAPEPAEAGAARQLALEHGRGVDGGARGGQRVPDLRLEEPQQRDQLRLHDSVVVASARIARDDAAAGVNRVVRRMRASAMTAAGRPRRDAISSARLRPGAPSVSRYVGR